jgi:hypothetical protein
MSKCEVEDCTFQTEAMSTYEDSHKVMTRHLTAHLIQEVRNLGDRLVSGNSRLSEARHSPEGVNAVLDPKLAVPGPLLPVSEPRNIGQLRKETPA